MASINMEMHIESTQRMKVWPKISTDLVATKVKYICSKKQVHMI